MTTRRRARKRKATTPSATKRKRAPVLDPVTRYATRVVAGQIVAGRLVRLACQRHLDDLARVGRDRAFKYHFEPKKAARLFEFFTDYLTLDDGSAFVLMPWLQFIFGSIVGWVNADGYRRFTTAYLETAKGTGKTPAAAGFGLFALVADHEQSAEVYSLGVNGDQASYLFKMAKGMAERNDDLHDFLVVGEHNIALASSNSYFRPLTSEGRSLDNKRPHVAIIDELHEHPSDVIPEKMRLGFKGRKQPVRLELTNSGHDQTSVCWEHHDYSRQVLEGGVTDDRWFAYVCQLDPCEKCRAAGSSQPNDGCPDCDHWTDERVWLKSHPSLGVTISYEQLRDIVQSALNIPREQARVKRLYFCMWTQAHTIWIQTDRWDACRVADVAERNDMRPCAAGFDMSEKLDLTACAIASRIDDDPGAKEEEVELVEIVTDGDGAKQEIKKKLSITFTVELAMFFWLPEETLLQRVRDEHVPLDVWRSGGNLFVTPGPVIDYDAIYDEMTARIIPAFRPQRIGYDPHNATQFAVALRDRAKQTVAEVTQGRALSESFKLFEALVRMKRVRHNGNPVMGWCVSNASPKRDRYENMWLEKPSATKRIDGVIAAVIALSQLVLLPARRRMRRGAAKVWTPNGFVDAGDQGTRG